MDGDLLEELAHTVMEAKSHNMLSESRTGKLVAELNSMPKARGRVTKGMVLSLSSKSLRTWQSG